MSTGKIELSVGAVKYVDPNEIITEEQFDYINNKVPELDERVGVIEDERIPELDERVGVIEDEIEEINSSLDNMESLKATKQEVDVERKRIDTFTKLSEGSTTGDAELIDGRLGADGVIYKNIGSSIRGQFQKINDYIVDNNIENYPLSMTRTNKYIDHYGAEQSGDGFYQATINVNDGEKYFITSYSYYNMARFATKDSDGNVIRKVADSSGMNFYENTEIIISENEKQLIIQSGLGELSYVIVKKENGIKLKENIITINNLDDNLKTNLNSGFAPIELDFTQYPMQSMKFTIGSKPGVSTYTIDSNFNMMKIEVNEGDVFKIRGRHYYSAHCWGVCNADNVCIQKEMNGEGDSYEVVEEFTIASGGKYLYISSFDFYYIRKKTSINYNSPLKNKKIVFNGDSICETRIRTNTLDNGGGYAKLVSDIVDCDFVNRGVSGGRLVSSRLTGSNAHSIVDTLENLPTDGDIYCFEGGINDYWTNVELGTFDKYNYKTELDTTTVCGALEYIFRYCINNFTQKQICFIIVHKITNTGWTENAKNNTFEEYREKMIGICEKYGILYYDAYTKSGLNGSIEIQNNTFLTSNKEGIGDGTHPNKLGYMKHYVPQLIKLFETLITN